MYLWVLFTGYDRENVIMDIVLQNLRFLQQCWWRGLSSWKCPSEYWWQYSENKTNKCTW